MRTMPGLCEKIGTAVVPGTHDPVQGARQKRGLEAVHDRDPHRSAESGRA